MKSLFQSLILLSISFISAQSIDYNLKKGYIANGYDVVVYFSNKAIEGSNQFKTTFDGVDYKFSSEENLNTFLKDPKKYMPQYGGYCAYAIGAKGEKVGIDPKTFQINDGKLYLFYNAWGTNTLKLWNDEGAEALQKKPMKTGIK
ncbi:YHS domain-containing (seleno)protein [Flavobacteriaceae bacterium SZ-1-7]|uniref:YHS domain-containing (seleno)protein n=1 Tax=Tamlana sedimenti TaxID=3134126 RepID=UPI0031258B4E